MYAHIIPATLKWKAASSEQHPLGAYFEIGFLDQFPAGWHRVSERYARKLDDIATTEQILENWEENLIWTETLLLAGLHELIFLHLAHAWGQKNDFHYIIAAKKLQGGIP